MNTENYFVISLAIAAAFFLVCWALSPVVLRLDRISFVVAAMSPQLHGMLELKMYWYLYKNEGALKEMENKHKINKDMKFESNI